jgi:hypothetical protein
MKRVLSLAAVAAGLVALACGGAGPTAVVQPAPVAVNEEGGTVTASSGGKIPIVGQIVGDCNDLPPSREFVTPGGIDHFFEWPICTTLAGDVASVAGQHMWFTESGAFLRNGKAVFHGPFAGDVTWMGQTGQISGTWHTLCETGVPTCGGTFEAQGSGALEGVKFHFVWGPGWYPFDYTGFAIDNRK